MRAPPQQCFRGALCRWLRFANNRLHGRLPPSFRQLAPHLVQLTLDSNDFTGN